MEFVFVKGGCFEMGDIYNDGYFAERPVHTVCLDDFYIGRYEVTEGQWSSIMTDDTSYKKKTDRYPVVNVTFFDVQVFIERLNRKTDKKYRLPTEAEWEYACRSGGKNERYSGFSNQNEMSKYANFCDINCGQPWMTGTQDDGYEGPAPVGSYKPNGLGLYDMSGNVWEWLEDRFDTTYYKRSPKDNPKGSDMEINRVIRGGCYLNSQFYMRCSYRLGVSPDSNEKDIGFRLAISAENVLDNDFN